MDRFYCDNLVIRDDYGRQRIFKGINFCSKERKISAEKFRRKYSINKIRDKMLCDGVNLIRFGVTWASIEPEEGQTNTDIIAEHVKFVMEC